MLLVDLFDRGATGDPGRACLITADGSRRISWGEAVARTHCVAASLADAGVGPGTSVGVLSPNDPDALLCALGALRLNASWVPLNARARPDEIAAVLRSTECRALFYHGSLRAAAEVALTATPEVALAISIGKGRAEDPVLEDWVATPGVTVAPPPYEPDRAAILFGTGGTTGTPKAVRMTHPMLVTMVLAMEAHLFEPEPSVFAMAAPMSHAAGLLALATLAHGGTIVIHDGVHAAELLRSIARHRVTRLFLPPTAIYALLGHRTVREFDYSSLRHLVYAAAPMAVDKLEEALEVFGPVMCQMYGQAEAPMMVTCMTPAEHVAALERPGGRQRLASAGRPSLCARVAVMAEDGTLLPPGDTGELVVRSNLVMPGYFGDPEPSTGARRPGGWHGTSDAGFVDEDGYVYIVDRLRDMIITGGFNVWPSEVERLIHGLPGVGDCAVIGLPDPKWGEAVTAVIEARAGASIDEAEIVAACKDALGSIKAPKRVIVRELPRSPVGKVLKRSLRDEYWAGRERAV